MPALPREVDPYKQETPYEFLGVDRNASARDIRNQHTRLKREIQDSGLSPSERAKRTEALDEAYNQIRVSANRVQVDFFFVNNEVGVQQCRKIAQSVGKPQTDVGDLIRPKRISANHLVVVDAVEKFFTQPEKVSGFHPQPTGIGQQLSIPAPLRVHFDC